LSFSEGNQTPFNVAGTGPAGYVLGGIYEADPTGTPLPTGLLLTDAGSLTAGRAVATVANNARFRYFEPGTLPSMTLHSGATTGTLPYMGTVYPLEGAVPAGQVLGSIDDTDMRSSVLSAWPDGSAAVVVLAGRWAGVTANNTYPLRLRSVLPPAGTNLTAARVGQLVTSVAVNLGAIGSGSITSFGTPDKIWWTNPNVICARYHFDIGADVQVIIDIHAFASIAYAFVEVMVENCKVNSSSPSLPSAKTYTGATVSVNGVQIGGTVASPTNGQTFTAPTDGSGTMTWGTTAHEGLRAWYRSTWVGGDPLMEVTHDTTYLQGHPAFNRLAGGASTYNLANYASDAYTPFSHQRHAPFNMGGTGDNKWIGHLPQWETRYIQTGDKRAARASINSALAVLTYAVNYRDSTTGLVPTFTQIGSKSRNASTWPQASNGSSDPAVWEIGHAPAAGLVAFLCRPSPCFIEIAQKVAVWTETWTDPTVFTSMFYQTRGRAWAFRNLTHAIFLTPDGDAWKTPAKSKLAIDLGAYNQFRLATNNPLSVITDGNANNYLDHCPNSGVSSEGVGFQQSLWQHWLTVQVLHSAHFMKLLSGASQTLLGSIADWAGESIVRYINEMPGQEWKYIRHMTTCGQQNYNSSNSSGSWGGGLYLGPDMVSLATWPLMDDWWMLDAAPSTNVWRVSGNSTGTVRTYASGDWSSDTVANTGLNYATWFWSGLVAAVERSIPGADAAWTKVNTLSGLATWLNGYALDPRQGHYPRNK